MTSRLQVKLVAQAHQQLAPEEPQGILDLSLIRTDGHPRRILHGVTSRVPGPGPVIKLIGRCLRLVP